MKLHVSIGALLASLLLMAERSSSTHAAPERPPVRTPGGALTKTLANGLHVVVIENHAAPIAIVDTWFAVGSRNEGRQEQGISHFLEHMLFNGSEGMTADEYKQFVLKHAAFENAYTNCDHTHYFQLAPVRYFPALLKVNRTLVSKPLLLDEEFNREREAVKEELRRNLDRGLYFLFDLVLPRACAHTGYDHPVIGDATTLDAQQNEWMRAYYHRYYGPNNAIVVAIGDFTAESVLTQIEETYGDWKQTEITPSPEIRPFTQVAPQVLVGHGGYASNYLLFAWPTIKIGSPEAYALDVLATILGDGSSSRLMDELKRRRGLVNSVSAYHMDRIDLSSLVVEVHVADAARTEETSNAILAVIGRMKDEGPSLAELDRAKRSLALDLAFKTEDLVKQANQIGKYRVLTGDLTYMESYTERIYGVTAADVKWAAREFLTANHATVGLATSDVKVTALAPDWKGLGDGERAPPRPKDLGRLGANPFPRVGTANSVKTASTNRLGGLVTYKTDGGMEVLLLRTPSIGTAGVSLATRDGLASESWETSGVGALTTRTMPRGTARRSGDLITEEMDTLGGRFTFTAGADTIELRTLVASIDLPRALDLLSDLTDGATFPEEAVASERASLLASIKSRVDDSYACTHDQLAYAIFGRESPYGRPPLGRSSVIESITREQIRGFHRRSFSPTNLVLAITGDIDPAQARAEVERTFGKLRSLEDPRAATAPTPSRGAPREPTAFVRIIDNVPKAQTMTFIGVPGGPLSDPDLPSVRLLSHVLGGTWASRLSARLRGREGLCYNTYSVVESHVGGGVLVAWIGTRPEKWDAAVSGLRREFNLMSNAGITQQELTDAITYLAGDLDRRLAGVESQASLLATNVAMGLKPDQESQEIVAMTGLDIKSVNEVAKRRFAAEKAWLATTGPIFELPAQLK